MIGAVAGDMIGSPYEGYPTKSTKFPARVARFTDDTVLTVASRLAILIGWVTTNYTNSSEVRLPNGTDNMRNCAGCHDGTTFAVPLDENVSPTTILTGTDLASPYDDTNVTPIASVCSSCHDGVSSKTHMAEEGPLFDFVPFAEPRISIN